MQDIHSIGGGGGGGGGGGRLFGGGGGGGGGDRRLRPHHHHQNHQPLKCPRCDSLNTKFCYYNNYNLSQPRHFCKSCRRYWTKGGVLRNVPVGGGCRKTKRSKPKQQQITSAPDTTTTTTTTPPPQDQQDQPRQQRQREQLKSSNSHSSSESSSTLTATNTAATATTAVEAASGHSSSTKPPNTHNSSNCNTDNSDYITLSGINESKLFSNANNLDPNLEVGLQQLEQGSSDCGIFSEIGSFSSLINTNNEQLQFGFGSLMMNQMGLGQGQDQSWQHQNHKMVHQQHQRIGGINGEEVKMQDDMGGGGGGGVGGGDGGLIDDPTVQVEYGRFGALDWQGTTGDHHGLFDLHNTVDHAYWTSQSQWTDQDHPGLYLP